jgi:hypothetical protein
LTNTEKRLERAEAQAAELPEEGGLTKAQSQWVLARLTNNELDTLIQSFEAGFDFERVGELGTDAQKALYARCDDVMPSNFVAIYDAGAAGGVELAKAEHPGAVCFLPDNGRGD